MLIRGRLLARCLVLAALAAGAGAAPAGAWTLSASADSLKATPTTEPEFALSVTGDNNGNADFTPAASNISGTGCHNDSGQTVCPLSLMGAGLEIDGALATYVSNITTADLHIVGAPSSDQWTLDGVTVGLLDVDPGTGTDQLSASGSVGTMVLGNKSSGSIAIMLDTGPTVGNLNVGSGNNYVYAPNSLLNITGDGNFTAGGTLQGSSGNDTFHATSTTQTITGGSGGHNAVTFTRISQPLTIKLQSGGVLLNNDTTAHVTGFQDITAGSGNDTVIGSPPPGSSGPFTLRGGPGNDLFLPMGGPEVIDGSPGNTMNTVDYSYLPASTPLTVDLGHGVGAPTGTPANQQDQLTNIEGVIGNDGADNITGSGVGGTFMLGNGDNTLTGSPENDTIQAGSGTDHIDGGGGNDTITGGSGTDTLVGGPGNNYMKAGSGTTTFEDSGGDNTMIGGGGNDTVSYANRTAGQGVVVTLNGSAGSSGNGQPGENDAISGIENIIGGAGNDTLTGDSNANVIQAGSGNTTIDGKGGNDTLIGGSGNDTITAGVGENTITTGNGDNKVDAFVGQSTVTCGSGFNTVIANPADTIKNCQSVSDPLVAPSVYNPLAGPPSQVTSLVKTNFSVTGSRTTVTTLTVLTLAPNSGIALVCESSHLHACPFRKQVFNYTSARAAVKLAPLFHGRRLPPGTKLILRITAPHAIGRYIVLTTRSGEVPRAKTSCLDPTTDRVTRCSTNTKSVRHGGRRRAYIESTERRHRTAAAFAAATATVSALARRDAAALALARKR